MRTLEWLNGLIENHLVCEQYIKKIISAKSKKQLFSICADSNGISFLPMMRAKGVGIDYAIIENEFSKYINGKFKPEYGKEYKYLSAIYIGVTEQITIDTTIASLNNCKCVLRVIPNFISSIAVDKNCELDVFCPDSSRLVIEIWGNPKINIIEGEDRIKIKKGGIE